jgi:hypothetical protein
LIETAEKSSCLRLRMEGFPLDLPLLVLVLDPHTIKCSTIAPARPAPDGGWLR